MTLYQLEVFALVAKLGSFTKAAQELHVGQSSVSSLMVELQKELGVKLFEKLGIKTHLTEAGKSFLLRTQQVIATIKEAKEEMDEIQGLRKGRLSVGGCSLAAASGLPLAIQAFKKTYLGVQIGLTIDQSKG
ncbi:MAG: LysR family transcriptional regulator, partial [Candidatus Binatia bacterium]